MVSKKEKHVTLVDIVDNPSERFAKVVANTTSTKRVVAPKALEDGISSLKKTRPPSKWIIALKEYNKDKDVYHIPKKGTIEYNLVKAIMEKL